MQYYFAYLINILFFHISNYYFTITFLAFLSILSNKKKVSFNLLLLTRHFLFTYNVFIVILKPLSLKKGCKLDANPTSNMPSVRINTTFLPLSPKIVVADKLHKRHIWPTLFRVICHQWICTYSLRQRYCIHFRNIFIAIYDLHFAECKIQIDILRNILYNMRKRY